MSFASLASLDCSHTRGQPRFFHRFSHPPSTTKPGQSRPRKANSIRRSFAVPSPSLRLRTFWRPLRISSPRKLYYIIERFRDSEKHPLRDRHTHNTYPTCPPVCRRLRTKLVPYLRPASGGTLYASMTLSPYGSLTLFELIHPKGPSLVFIESIIRIASEPRQQLGTRDLHIRTPNRCPDPALDLLLLGPTWR